MHDDSVDVQTVPRREAARIIRDPHICGGEPIVAGARAPVSSVVVQWQMYQDRGRVLSAFPRLDDQSLSAALAYYEANRQEIDRLIDENEQAASARS